MRLPSYCFRVGVAVWALWTVLLVPGCGPSGPVEPEWPAESKRWYERAEASYQQLDAEDARAAITKALQVDPQRVQSRLLAAQIALGQLDYEASLGFAKGLQGSAAHAVRGRALWYAGKIADAGAEFEALLADPAIKDPWAEDVLKLARQGTGREPFAMRGSLLAVMEMPRLQSTVMVIPIELNGQPVLGMLSTSSTEVIVDSSASREPSWVSLRFDGRVEVKDVPAFAKDLSGLSREVNAPIKVLLGTNILRHLNVTFDFMGRQFVVRNYEPPPPPVATRVPVQYIRGGGMMLRSQIGVAAEAPSFNLLVDSASTFALALDDGAWKRTGTDPANLIAVEGSRTGLRQARLSQVKLGSFDVPSVPAVSGVGFTELEQSLGIELDGLLGSALLSEFRVTLSDGGRTLWFEDLPAKMDAPRPAQPAAVGDQPASSAVPSPAPDSPG